MKPQASEAFAAFVGLDWADAKHDVCLQAAGTARREFLQPRTRPEAIDAWVQTLRTRFNGQPVAVCLELNKGPIVSALRNYDFLVLFPVNPLTVAKYREAFTPSRAKDDPTDAELQVELLLKHRDKLTPLSPQSPTMRALAQLVEHRRRLVGDKVRLHQSLDQCPQKLLSPRPAMVSGERYGDLLRLPQPLADPQSRATRAPHHPGGLLPCPPRALGRRHRHPHRGHQERHGADHR